MVTITTPNGTSTTLGPYETDVSGTYQVTYTPTTVGTYTFQMSFPGQTVNGTGYGNYFANFLPSTSPLVSLTVQQAPLTAFQEAPVPLPTQYWTQPINAQNRAWNAISGPWLISGYNSTGPYNPYTYPVLSPHVLWRQSTGPNEYGIVGGAFGSVPFGGTSGVTGTGYPEIALNSRTTVIIIGGYMYYNSAPQVVQGLTQGNTALQNQQVPYFTCQNLQTGQIIWTVSGQINYGQVLDWRSQQQRIVCPYLWYISSGEYQMYDAVNGALLAQWTNLPVGTKTYQAVAPLSPTAINSLVAGMTNPVYGPIITLTSPVTVLSGTVMNEPPNPIVVGQNIGGASGGGALLVYLTGHATGSATGWLACWNSTLALNSINGDPTVWNYWSSGTYNIPTIQQQLGTSNPPVTGVPLNWQNGIMWNYTLPAYTAPNVAGVVSPVYPSIVGVDENYVVMSTGKTSANATGTEFYGMMAFSQSQFRYLTFGQTATAAWTDNIQLPAYDQTYPGSATLRSDGNIIYEDNSVLQIWDFSESTGALLWTSSPFNNDFEFQDITGTCTVANGMLYYPGYDGYIHALNTTTGVQVWDSITRAGALEMPEPAYPASAAIIAGPTLATSVLYSSTTKAYETQPYYRGHSLFAYNAATGAQLWNISGQFTAIQTADGILVGFNNYDGYYYAFGPGQTATTVTAPLTEVTAGSNLIIQGTVTDQTSGTLKGTPAIADVWMGQWMAYELMDQPLPTQATGVNVVLTAIDPNNNVISIGNATSDLSGMFSYHWSPPNVPGKYTIIATFNADNSYYGSCAETAAYVTSPATTATAPTATPTSVADMYFVPAIAGLFVLIIIVAIVLALLMLRKRP
jgi:hypothetical protein